jgi:MbtH protein
MPSDTRGLRIWYTFPIVLYIRRETMTRDEHNDMRRYKVVINHEEQFSIWFADRANPLGWRDVGKTGTRQECLDYIEEIWTDMRPLSVRMEQTGPKTP